MQCSAVDDSCAAWCAPPFIQALSKPPPKAPQKAAAGSPNVDFYSGFVYDMLGIPMELYTPLFAVARVMGWSAHRIEELLSANKIIRPAYKSLGGTHEYIRRNERE